LRRRFLNPISNFTREDASIILFIRNIFGVTPGNIFLYKQALRHKSAAYTVKEGVRNSNERLEFLGDAILGAVVAEHLFRKFPFKEEGFLTETRSKIVSRVSLNKLALKLGVDQQIITSTDFNRNNPGTILGDAMEALIGALFLDKGFDQTRQIIIRSLFEIHINIEEVVETEVNFKSRIIEYCQQEKIEVEFRVAEEIQVRKNQRQHRVELVLNGEVIAEAIDFSIKGAEQRAAEKGLIALGIIQE
jgi:ribonuclease III